MRYFVGQCEYKWSHAHTDIEKLWVMREVGTDLFETVEHNNWTWVLIRGNSMSLPSDIYCRTLIYADSNDNKLDTHFVLKFPQVKAIPLAK